MAPERRFSPLAFRAGCSGRPGARQQWGRTAGSYDWPPAVAELPSPFGLTSRGLPRQLRLPRGHRRSAATRQSLYRGRMSRVRCRRRADRRWRRRVTVHPTTQPNEVVASSLFGEGRGRWCVHGERASGRRSYRCPVLNASNGVLAKESVPFRRMLSHTTRRYADRLAMFVRHRTNPSERGSHRWSGARARGARHCAAREQRVEEVDRLPSTVPSMIRSSSPESSPPLKVSVGPSTEVPPLVGRGSLSARNVVAGASFCLTVWRTRRVVLPRGDGHG